ncbi:J domain-containing protein [Pelomonas sp. BJYL3]|uniref:J domain-containing protein n=1 Tax=Pelomonas sp. BJYL3 TaxID=2976697 RepID=UPI0022B2AFCC|nr:J domain-containing protein [Pelomonas sp. BJYL3]
MNHYDTLEVSARASPEVLRAAYRSLIQRFHPDRRPDDPEAAARAAAITEAYDVLSDPVRRAAYDDWLAAQQAPAAPRAAGPSPAAAAASAATGGAARVRTAGTAGTRGTARPAPAGSSGRWVLGLLVLAFGVGLATWLWPRHAAREDDWASLRQSFSAPGHTEEELQALLRRKEALLQRQPALREREAQEAARDREARSLDLLDQPLEIYLGTGAMTIPRVQLVLGTFDGPALRSYILKNRETLVRELSRALNAAKPELLLGPDAEHNLQSMIQDTLTTALGTQPQESYPSTWFESPGRYGVVAVQLPGRYSFKAYGAGPT